MLFETHQIKSPFDEYIESIFYFKNFNPGHSIERVVPTGHLFIIFELDDIPRNTFDSETLEIKNQYQTAWISGIHKNHIAISAHQNSEMLVIQFKPCGAYPFLQIPMSELSDKVIPATEIFDHDLINLRKQIITIATPQEKFEIVEQWLVLQFKSDKIPPVEIQQLVQNIQTRPLDSLIEIIQDYSSSQKHLISLFKQYIGITPKYFQRIIRFNLILQQIQNNQTVNWSDIVYNNEFTDQSHFIKEFKHFSGINPQSFLAKDFHRQEPNFFPLD